MNRVPVRPAEHLVHVGPVVILSGRVCAYLNRYANLERFRIEHRGSDPEVDHALVAMKIAALNWSASATGSTEAARPEVGASSETWMSTEQAATALGITSRAIRQAIAEHRLNATLVGRTWRINKEDIAHYRANRSA